MAEQTFRSPGFFPREVDLGLPARGPSGIPAGVVGTALRGPAFIPVTVGNFNEFDTAFGGVSADRFGVLAVQEFLRYKQSCTFVRVLGGGSNDVSTDFLTTERLGTVKNAGFKLEPAGAHQSGQTQGGQIEYGAVQFIVAKHYVSQSKSIQYPIFSQNDSFQGDVREIHTLGHKFNDTTGKVVAILRAVLFTTSGSLFRIRDWNINLPGLTEDLGQGPDYASPDATDPRNAFKLILSSTSATFAQTPGGLKGVQVYSASLDPDSNNYLGKILNTDPLKFQERQHLLYLDLPVDNDIAPVYDKAGSIGILSGSTEKANGAAGASLEFIDAFGRFDTRYKTPRTPWIKSQPFGSNEYDLFYVETLSDGAYANDKFKVSIANLKASADNTYPYGTFEVQIRNFDDTDVDKKIIERYPGCNLDPLSNQFVGRVIGDMKESFNWDGRNETERRIVVTGQYANRSLRVRVVLSTDLQKGNIPRTSLPFGFGGIPVIKTSDALSHIASYVPSVNPAVGQLGYGRRLWMSGCADRYAHTGPGESAQYHPAQTASLLTSSIMPPLPLRFKVTKGNTKATPLFSGHAGAEERVSAAYYWGVQNTRITSSRAVNASQELNPIVNAYTKFHGIQKLDMVVTGAGVDVFNNNAFTLSRVALHNELDAAGHISAITGTAKEHMLEAAYIRGMAKLNEKNYTVIDPTGSRKTRITLGTLLNSSSVKFNKFTEFAKFTTIFYGGFDGLNILDRDQFLMNDRATSTATRGKASSDFSDLGLSTQPAGTGKDNSIIRAYRMASKLLTNKYSSNINILAIPGIREQYVTDYASDRTRDYGLAIYLMDLEIVDENQTRLFNNEGDFIPDVDETAAKMDGRGVDNNFVASYFPDVFIQDRSSGQVLYAPASVAALQAVGQNDNIAKPWFAPAGFSRGALASVTNVKVRLTAVDRDTLYESRINPIATFPNSGFVIFGQKTLQLAQSALDRVNVRRMLLDVKRAVIGVARRILFEQNTPATRARFVSQVTPLLALVQAQQGIDQFRVVMDDTNNTQDDVLNNQLNGKIVIVPTRAVEFIAIDFIIDQAGVTFV